MKKIFILLLSLFLVSCNSIKNEKKQEKTTKNNEIKQEKVVKKNTNNQIVNNSITEKNKTLEEKVKSLKLDWEEYWDLKAFIKKDLDDSQKKEVLKFLKQREESKKEIEKIFSDILENWWFKEKFEKIKSIREKNMNNILPFVKNDLKEKFIRKYEISNTQMKILYYKSPKKIK